MMHTIALFSWICACSFSQSLLPTTNSPGSLDLQIDNIQTSGGEVHVAIYDREESFAKSLTPFLLKIYQVPADRKLSLQLPDIPYGRYALAVYHDENGNGELDKNLFGIPKEPYGFSNNPKAKWSAPTYDEVAFELREKRANLSISLKKWKDR